MCAIGRHLQEFSGAAREYETADVGSASAGTNSESAGRNSGELASPSRVEADGWSSGESVGVELALAPPIG